MIAERDVSRKISLEIVVAAVAGAGPQVQPFTIAGRHLTVRARARRIGVLRRSVVELHRPGRGRRTILSPPFEGGRRLALPLRIGNFGRRLLPIGVVGTFQQRIAFELTLDIVGQVEIRQLQQLDGLHQLRRHNERLALPEFKALGKRHFFL
jgi:hypothetical protein